MQAIEAMAYPLPEDILTRKLAGDLDGALKLIDVYLSEDRAPVLAPRLLLEKQGALTGFAHIGTSVHSVAEALAAQNAGATCLTAGHIFDTDCKKGLPGRGLDFLRSVCQQVSIPVYAIGGIDSGNIGAVRGAGAAGACVMSGLMRCGDPGACLRSLDKS